MWFSIKLTASMHSLMHLSESICDLHIIKDIDCKVNKQVIAIIDL